MDTKSVHDNEIVIAGAQLSSLQAKNRSQLAAAKSSDAADGKKDDTNGKTPRRDSLRVVDVLGDAFFGRRTSLGLGADMPLDMGAVGGNMMARRGSMDSVVDAAIQNLASRRLSMLGGTTHAAMNAGAINNNLDVGTGMASLGMNHHAALMGMQSRGINGPMGMNASGPGGLAMSSQMNQFLMNGLGLAQTMASSNPGETATDDNAAASEHSDGDTNSNVLRQQQLQEQRVELQRRQEELEFQRQQLLTAMEERKQAMQHMQQSMQQGDLSHYVPVERRHSLFGGKVGALEGPISSTNGEGDEEKSPSGAFFLCKFCNSKAYSHAEEALACENLCRRKLENKWRQNTGILSRDERRGSLDLLGALAGVTQEVESNSAVNKATTSNPESSQNSVVSENSSGQMPGPIFNSKDKANFATMKKPLPLGLPGDKDWLTPLHCFVRLHCVEVFTASEADVAIPTKGKRKPIQIGQVGIRCPHCHNADTDLTCRERGSVYYPTSVSSIYNATMNLLQRHLHSCTSVKPDIMEKYETLKSDDARSGTSKKYWAQSALSLGLVDTNEGIRFSAAKPPPLPKLTSEQKASDNYSAVRGNDDEFFNSDSNALVKEPKTNQVEGSGSSGGVQAAAKVKSSKDDLKTKKREYTLPDLLGPEDSMIESMQDTEQHLSNSAPLVTPDDEKVATQFSFYLLGQMQMCVFTEADRLGKRKGLPPGFPGLACRHCFGGYGSGRFFPSSIKTLSDTSKTLNVLFNHMMRCRKCPVEVRETLEKLRKVHDDQRAKMKFGSQKAFFARIWDRLHDNDPTVDARKRKFNQPRKPTPQPTPTAPNPVSAQSAAAENLMNMQMGGGQLGQHQYLDAASAFRGSLGGLTPAGLLGGFGVGGMLQGANPFASAAAAYTGDSESNKRFKLQDFSHSNNHQV